MSSNGQVLPVGLNTFQINKNSKRNIKNVKRWADTAWASILARRD